MSKSLKFKLFLCSTVIFVLSLDLYSKWVIVNMFDEDPYPISQPINVLGNIFKITYVQNHGITFGLLSDLPKTASIIILSMTSISALLILLYFFNNMNTLIQEKVVPYGQIALSLIFGGACGNIIDRLMRGFVVDFLDFGIDIHRWYIFNIADAFIVVGCIALSILMFIFEVKNVKKKDPA